MKATEQDNERKRYPSSGKLDNGAAGKDEATIRKDNIDKALLVAGWKKVVPFNGTEVEGTAAVEENPTDNGPADYVLYHNSIPLAIVGGKETTISS